jgi:hypothetical protein
MGSDMYKMEMVSWDYDPQRAGELAFQAGYSYAMDVAIRNIIRMRKNGKNQAAIMKRLEELRADPPKKRL